MSSSAALRTNDIWSKTIGHNPYKNSEEEATAEADHADQSAGLMLLAKMTNVSGSETRGGCSKCGMMGHLRFQCRNTIQLAPAVADDSSSSSSSDEEEEERPQLRGAECWGTSEVSGIRGRSPERRDRPRHDRSRSRDEGSYDSNRGRLSRGRDSNDRSDSEEEKQNLKKHKKKEKSHKSDKKHKDKKKKSSKEKKEKKSKKDKK